MSHRHPYRAEIARVARTGAALADQVEHLATGDWARPTPCPQWTVRRLVGHTVSIICDLGALAREESLPPALGDTQFVDGPAVAERIRSALDTGLRPWDQVHLSALRQFPWGTTPAVRALQFTAIEIVGHGWDLAIATGVPVDIRDDDSEALIGVAHRHLPAAAGSGLFDAARLPPASAPALDRLAAALGRHVDINTRS